MKTVLIAASQFTYYEKVRLGECLGVWALATTLKKNGLSYELVDFENTSPLSDKTLSGTIEKSVKTILRKKPQILAVSAMTTNLIFALEICHKIKQLCPQIITIIGGPGVTFCGKDVIERFSFVNIVFKGEGDSLFPLLINRIISKQWIEIVKMPGVVTRFSEIIFENEQAPPIECLDNLGYPPYDNSKKMQKLVYIELGRGCPFHCTYCSTSSFFSRKYRCKSPERIIEEIRFHASSNSKLRIIFYHDMLTFSREYVEDLCRKIHTILPNVRWSCSSRLDFLDIDLIEKMYRAGCCGIFIGIEAASEKLQKSIQKNLDLSKLPALLNKMNELSIEVTLSFITGFVDQDKDDSLALINRLFEYKYWNNSFYNSHRRMIQIHPLHLDRGAALYEQYKDRMVLDSHGSPGESESPSDICGHVDIILNNPNIFSSYFHIAETNVNRKLHLMMSFLANITHYELRHSFFIVFLFLKQDFSKLLWNKIDDICIPENLSQRHNNLLPFMNSLEMIIARELAGEVLEIFRALFTYEKHIYIARNSDNKKHKLFFTSTYDLPLIISFLRKNKQPNYLQLEQFRTTPRTYFVYIERKRVLLAQVPTELFSLAETALIVE